MTGGAGIEVLRGKLERNEATLQFLEAEGLQTDDLRRHVEELRSALAAHEQRPMQQQDDHPMQQPAMGMMQQPAMGMMQQQPMMMQQPMMVLQGDGIPEEAEPPPTTQPTPQKTDAVLAAEQMALQMGFTREQIDDAHSAQLAEHGSYLDSADRQREWLLDYMCSNAF
eukprot:COSAG01_NODE_1053_length_11913_cov_4.198307_8_plen_168_part_00